MNIKLFAKGIVASAKKNAPQLCIAGGIICGAAALITACIQTTKLNDIIDDGKAQMEERQKAVDECKERRDEETGEAVPYTQEDCDHDKRAVYFRTAWRIVKLYAIPTALSALAIFLILKGNKLHTANTAKAVAVGNAAVASLNSAKERAREVVGEEKAREIFDGVKPTGEFIDKEWTDEEGKKHKAKCMKYEAELDEWGCDGRSTFLYSAKTSTMHSENHMANQIIFTNQERDLDRILEWEGCFTVNDVLKRLGIPKTDQGMNDGRISEEYGGNCKGLMFTATLVDPETETYIIEIPIDGDIKGRAGEVYRRCALKKVRG